MAKSLIPLRPKEGNYKQLTENELDALTWYVLSGRPRLDVFIEFVRPDLVNSPTKKMQCEQFFAFADVRKYLKNYQETIQNFFSPKKKKETNPEDREKKAERALNRFKDNVIDSLEDDVRDVEVLKDKAQLAKTIGLLKEEEVTQAPPQRYLPERCGSCAYKKFIEEQVELGNIIED